MPEIGAVMGGFAFFLLIFTIWAMIIATIDFIMED